MHSLAQGLRKVKFRWNKVSSWQQRILRAKSLTLVVCFLLPLKGERKTDTCSLFPPFGDPWPSCLLPLTCFRRRLGDSSFCLFLPHLALSGRRGGGAGHRQPVRSCSLVCFCPVGPRNASPGLQDKECVLWQQPQNLGGRTGAQAPFTETRVTWGGTEGEHDDGTWWLLRSLAKIAVDP